MSKWLPQYEMDQGSGHTTDTVLLLKLVYSYYFMRCTFTPEWNSIHWCKAVHVSTPFSLLSKLNLLISKCVEYPHYISHRNPVFLLFKEVFKYPPVHLLLFTIDFFVKKSSNSCFQTRFKPSSKITSKMFYIFQTNYHGFVKFSTVNFARSDIFIINIQQQFLYIFSIGFQFRDFLQLIFTFKSTLDI